MHAPRRIVASLTLAGLLAAGGFGCSSSKGGTNGDFCTKLRKYSQDKALNGGGTDTASMNKALAAFNDLASSAPSAIKPDVDEMKKVLDAYKQIQKDPTKAASFAAQIDTKKMTTATANIEKYAKDTCKVNINS